MNKFNGIHFQESKKIEKKNDSQRVKKWKIKKMKEMIESTIRYFSSQKLESEENDEN